MEYFFKYFAYQAGQDDGHFHVTPSLVFSCDGGIGIGVVWGKWIVAIGWGF